MIVGRERLCVDSVKLDCFFETLKSCDLVKVRMNTDNDRVYRWTITGIKYDVMCVTMDVPSCVCYKMVKFLKFYFGTKIVYDGPFLVETP